MAAHFFPRDEYFMRLALREGTRALDHHDVPIDLSRREVKPDGLFDIPPGFFFGVARRSAAGKFGAECRETSRIRVEFQDNAELHGFSIGLLPLAQLR